MSAGGVLFFIGSAIATGISLFFGMYMPMKTSPGGVFDEELAKRLSILSDSITAIFDLVLLAGSILLIVGLKMVFPWLSTAVRRGLRWVCTGMLVIAVVSLVGTITELLFIIKDQDVLTALTIFSTTAVCVAMVAMCAGLAGAGRESGLSAEACRRFRSAKLAMTFIAVSQVITLILALLMFCFDQLLAPLFLAEMLLVKPARMIGYVLLATGWARLMWMLRSEMGGHLNEHGS